MTESRQYVRALLCSCVHKPKFSAMHAPKKGDHVFCYACRKDRICAGIETGWERAELRCKACDWSYASQKDSKRKLIGLARLHANAHLHNVALHKDGYSEIIKANVGEQLPLIDNLLLP